MKNIIFTGGGTAGHIMPNLAIIEKLKGYNIYYFGSSGMEKGIIAKYSNIHFVEIPAVKFVRSLTLKNLTIPFKLMSAIKKAKSTLKTINPCLIFSKGGYVSIPVCLAGSKLGIPILTHESDMSVGLANKIIAKKSKHLLCSFESTAKSFGKNAIFTGSPIREKILHGKPENILSVRNINTKRPVILVVGGSQGAKAINNVILNSIETLTKKYTIIHIVGMNNESHVSNPNYIQIGFANNIEDYFAISDLVISRAGSNTIFELLAIHKPMILIPLPKTSGSRGDQELNANYFKDKNFAIVIEQENLNPETLLKAISNVLQNKSKLIGSMKKYNNTNGTDKIISIIHKCERN